MDIPHTHHVYEVVMTQYERMENDVEGFIKDHGGMDNFRVAQLTHRHTIPEQAEGSPAHTHGAPKPEPDRVAESAG